MTIRPINSSQSNYHSQPVSFNSQADGPGDDVQLTGLQRWAENIDKKHVEGGLIKALHSIPIPGIKQFFQYFSPGHGEALHRVYSPDIVGDKLGREQMWRTTSQINEMLTYMAIRDSEKGPELLESIRGEKRGKEGKPSMRAILKLQLGTRESLLGVQPEVIQKYLDYFEALPNDPVELFKEASRLYNEKNVNSGNMLMQPFDPRDIMVLKDKIKQAKAEGSDLAKGYAQISSRNNQAKQMSGTILNWMVFPEIGKKFFDKGIDKVTEEGGDIAKAAPLLAAGNLFQGAQSFEIARGALMAYNTGNAAWGPFAKVGVVLSHIFEPLLSTGLLAADPASNEMFEGSQFEAKAKNPLIKVGNFLAQAFQFLMPASLMLFSYQHKEEFKRMGEKTRAWENGARDPRKAQKPGKYTKYSRAFNFLMGPVQFIQAFTWLGGMIIQKVVSKQKAKKLKELEELFDIENKMKEFETRKDALYQKLISFVRDEVKSARKAKGKKFNADIEIERARDKALKQFAPEIQGFEQEYMSYISQVQAAMKDGVKKFDRWMWIANLAQTLSFTTITLNMFLGNLLHPGHGLLGLTTQHMQHKGAKFIPSLKKVFKGESRTIDGNPTNLFKNPVRRITTGMQGVLFPLVGLDTVRVLFEEGSPLIHESADGKQSVTQKFIKGLTENKFARLYNEYGWFLGMF